MSLRPDAASAISSQIAPSRLAGTRIAAGRTLPPNDPHVNTLSFRFSNSCRASRTQVRLIRKNLGPVPNVALTRREISRSSHPGQSRPCSASIKESAFLTSFRSASHALNCSVSPPRPRMPNCLANKRYSSGSRSANSRCKVGGSRRGSYRMASPATARISIPPTTR